MSHSLKLVGKDNPKLKTVCEKVEIKEGRILAKQMMKFALKLGRLAGLAAPQIGKSKRVFIFKKDNNLEMAINPKIITSSQGTSPEYEGCVSIPGYTGIVERNNNITVEYHNGEKKVACKLSGFSARCFQHEFDHLEGILYIDKLSTDKLLFNLITKKLVSPDKIINQSRLS